MRFSRVLSAVAVAFTLFQVSNAFAAGPPVPTIPANHLPVPIVRQATDYSCGAASMLAVLYYWQASEESESDLYSVLDTHPIHGTHPRGLVKGAKSYGLKASMKENLTLDDLRAALVRGETAIVGYQAWRGSDEDQDERIPVTSKRHAKKKKSSRKSSKGQVPWRDEWEAGHYSVVVGMDDANIYLMDPSAGMGYGHIPLAEFDERWHDYEDRDGYVWKYQRLAVFISGQDPIKQFPAPLIRVE